MEIAHRRITAVIYGLLCHGLFAVGVGMMIFQMYFGISQSFGTLAAPFSWLANGLLLLQFPLGHSLLLSGPGPPPAAAQAPKAERMAQRNWRSSNPFASQLKGATAAKGFAHPEIHLENHHANANGKQAMAQQSVDYSGNPAMSNIQQFLNYTTR